MLRHALLLGLLCLSFTACKETIVHDLSEKDANKIVTSLHKRAIETKKVKQADGLWSITVASNQRFRALSYLNDTRIVREQPAVKSTSSSLMSSREEQLFQFERALSQEIEYTLQSLPGVLESRVHLHIPARDPLFGQQIKDGDTGAASVLVITNDEFHGSKEAVQELIAGAAGVPHEDISVLIQQSRSPQPLPHNPLAAHTPEDSIYKQPLVQILLSLLIALFAAYLCYSRKQKVKLHKLKAIHASR